VLSPFSSSLWVEIEQAISEIWCQTINKINCNHSIEKSSSGEVKNKRKI
jgi:hypothetical protein